MADIFKYLSTNHDLVTAWTAIAALFVSLISIVFTFINIVMQRTHNRKSVLPIGHVSVGDYENSIFVRVRNDGAGPMIIEKLIVTKRENEAETQSALIEFMPALPNGYHWKTFVEDVSNRAISPEKYIELISFEGDADDVGFAKARQRIRRALSELSVKVEYRNVYEDKMPPACRNLGWFGRNL